MVDGHANSICLTEHLKKQCSELALRHMLLIDPACNNTNPDCLNVSISGFISAKKGASEKEFLRWAVCNRIINIFLFLQIKFFKLDGSIISDLHLFPQF